MTEPRTARGWQTSEITITNAAGESTSLEVGPDGLQIRMRWSPACLSREHARQILEFLADGLGFALQPGPAPSVPDLAERALGALAAAGRGEADSEVQREFGAGMAASVAASRPLPPLCLEDPDGDALLVHPSGPHYAATLTISSQDPVAVAVAFGLDRARATDLRDWLSTLLGDAPATCGDQPGPWREDQVCCLPAGHEGWHKALAASWSPGVTHAEWTAIVAAEAAAAAPEVAP